MISDSNFFIKNLNSDDLVAAPLAGISNLPFRKILRKYFNGVVYSEMISVEGISRRSKESLEYLDRYDGEERLVYQLFGGKAKVFADAIKVIEDSYAVEAYDINMGCPVKKVIKAGGGTSLLSDLPRLKDIVVAVRHATDKPFSIKIRIGLDDKHLVCKEVLKIAEGEGVNALIVHARTKADMFSGRVRLDILSELKSESKIAIIGNGGVVDSASYESMKATGVDGVMIGRGMMKAPWIFKAIRERKSVESYLSKDEIAALLFTMYEVMKERSAGEEFILTHYKHILVKFAVWFSRGMREAVVFRTEIYKTETIMDVLNMVDNFYRNYSDEAVLASN